MMLGDLKGRKVSFEKASQFLEEVHQLDQMRDWMVENYKIAKRMVTDESTPEMVQLKEQLSAMDLKIKRLGKFVRESKWTTEYIRDHDEVIANAESNTVKTQDRHLKKASFIIEMACRYEQRVKVVNTIEFIQTKMTKFDEPKKAKPSSQQSEIKRNAQLLHDAELGDREALNKLSQLAWEYYSARKCLDDIVRKTIPADDPCLRMISYKRKYRIGRHLFTHGCPEEARRWLEPMIKDIGRWNPYYNDVVTSLVPFLIELAVLNFQPSIELLSEFLGDVQELENGKLKHALIAAMPEILRKSTSRKIRWAILDYYKTVRSPHYVDSFYFVITQSNLAEERLFGFIGKFANGAAYETLIDRLGTQNHQLFPVDHRSVLEARRSKSEAEEWLIGFLSKPGMGKKFLLSLDRTLPPAVGPLCEILDPIVFAEICHFHGLKRPINILQSPELAACILYCSLRSHDPEYRDSLLGTECILRSMQLAPQAMRSATFHELLRTHQVEAEDHMNVVRGFRDLLERGRAIPGLSMNPDQKFLEFLVNITELDLNDHTLVRQINVFANETSQPISLFADIQALLPFILVPQELWGHLMDQAPPPNQVLYAITRIDFHRLSSPILKEAMNKQIKMILRNGVRTPLNLAIACFVETYESDFTFDQEIKAQAAQIIQKKAFAAGKGV